MNNKSEYKLFGFMSNNPFEFEGFLQPIFSCNSHCCWVQNKEDGKITPIRIEYNEDILPWSEEIIWPIEVKLWAYATDKSNIMFGDYDSLSYMLSDILNHLSPILRAEVLEFLGKEKDYLEAIENVSDEFKNLDFSIGEKWRKRSYDRVLSDLFIGREYEIETFSHFLKNIKRNAFTIHTNGEGGIGKTQLLKKYQDICKYSKCIYTKNLIDMYHSDSRGKIDMMRLIAENLSVEDFKDFKNILKRYSEASTEKERRALISELERSFDECYQDIGGKDDRAVVLFFDTYEVIQGGDFSRWIEDEFFPKLISLNHKTKIVTSGRYPLKKFSSETIELKPFNITDTEHFLQKCLYLSKRQALYEKLGGVDAVKIIHEFSYGHPILLALFADWCNYEYNYINSFELMKEISQNIDSRKVSPQIFIKILINKISSLREPENIAIPYLAFAYRRMTPEMLSFISNISLENSNKILLSILRPLSFIKYKGEETVLLHDVMRDMVNRHYWEKADPEGAIRKKIAERLVEYYDILLEDKDLSELQRAEYTTEKRYYQLYVDDRKSFQDFIRDFDEKIENYQLYHCEEIVDQTFYEKLSVEQQLEIDVRRIWWRNEAYATEKAKSIINEVKSNPEKDEILNRNERLKAYFSQEEGVIKHWSNEYKEAINRFTYAEKIFRKYKIGYRMLWALNWLGYSYYRSGNFDKSEVTLRKGIKEFIRYAKKRATKPRNIYVIITNIYSNLNAVLRHKGRFFEAIQYGEIAVSIARKKNNHRELARFLNALGETYKNLNKNYEALKSYDEALKHLEITPDPLLKARILIGKALISYRHPDYIYILEFFRKDNRDEAICSLRKMYSDDQVMVTLASKNLDEAEDILTGFNNKTNELADLYFYRAEVTTIDGKWFEAIDLFKKSEVISQEIQNEYRWADAIIGQLICYYFLRDKSQKYDREIYACVDKINRLKNTYHNLLGKMNIFLGNMVFETYLSKPLSDKYLEEYLKAAFTHYVEACHHMFHFTKITRYRFWSSFQILAKRLGDIPIEKLKEDTLESLRDIWLYHENQNICQKYHDEFNDIVDFAVERLRCYDEVERYEKSIAEYMRLLGQGINQGGKHLRFAPVFALMALQLKTDQLKNKKGPELSFFFAELARSYATNDNIFEAQRNSYLSLSFLKEASGYHLLKAYVHIGLATIQFRRGEYAKLLTKNTKQSIENSLLEFKKHMMDTLQGAEREFEEAKISLSKAADVSVDNEKSLCLLRSHLFARNGEFSFLIDSKNAKVEEFFKRAIVEAELGGDVFRQMAAISSLVWYYYFSGQWYQKERKIDILIDDFYYLSRTFRNAPVLSGRIESIKADLKYDQIEHDPLNNQLIKDAFRGYLVASRVNAEYSYKHFFEIITTIIERISSLPNESAKILLKELPMLKQEAPKGDIADEAYSMIEQALYIQSGVI